MMTVVYNGRRPARLRSSAVRSPTWRHLPDAEHVKRGVGSAVTGRGGRRQRKRSAAGSRAEEIYWNNVMTSNVALMHVALDRANRKLAQSMGSHPLDLGYRERRRRAKLRRRRARRKEA